MPSLYSPLVKFHLQLNPSFVVHFSLKNSLLQLENSSFR